MTSRRFAQPETWLTYELAFVGGYCDAASFVLNKTFTGHVEGNIDIKTMWRRIGTLVLFLWLLPDHALLAQANSEIAQTQQSPLAQLQIEQVSDLLGLTPALKRLQSLQGQEKCESKAGSLEELTIRQFVLESVQAATLDVDSAMGVIANERGTHCQICRHP